MESSESKVDENYEKQPGYIVVKEEFNDEPLELELEEDGNLRMSTLISQFSGACGLRFRNKDTGAMRGVRLNKDLFLPPNGADGWPTDVTFNVVYSRESQQVKRKIYEKDTEEIGGQPPKRPAQKPSDLAVLSLPWKTTEAELKDHFSKYGAIVFANIKKDAETGHSRGFGFIRFENYESQRKAMEENTHQIDGRAVVLKLTKKAEGSLFRKVFVGRLTPDLTRGDLMDYFSQFGTVNDITIPQPFRSFAFITFQDSSDAISILDQDHLIKGISVVTRSADPIQEPKQPAAISGGHSPNRMHMGAYNRSSQSQSNTEMIQQAVNQAMQQFVGQMAYGKRSFMEDSFGSHSRYPTHQSPQHSGSTGGHSPIQSSGLYGFNSTLSSLNSPIRTTGVTRQSNAGQGWNGSNGGTSPGHNPWDSHDPQSKNYTHGKSWL